MSIKPEPPEPTAFEDTVADWASYDTVVDHNAAILAAHNAAISQAVEAERNREHIFTPGLGTAMICSCGKVFNTTGEQNQHRQWHLDLANLKENR